jgi:hypothetical protein
LFQSKPNDGDPPHLIRFSPDEPLVRLRYVEPGKEVRIWDHATKSVEELAYDENIHSTWVFPFYIKVDWRFGGRWIAASRSKKPLFWLPPGRFPDNSNCMAVHGDRFALFSRDGILMLLDMSCLQDQQQ